MLGEYEEGLFIQARYARTGRVHLFRTVIAAAFWPLALCSSTSCWPGAWCGGCAPWRRTPAAWPRFAAGNTAAGSDEINALGLQLENAAYLLRERERELRASERRYRDLFDRAPSPTKKRPRGRGQPLQRGRLHPLALYSGAHARPLRLGIYVARAPDEARAALMRRIQNGQETALRVRIPVGGRHPLTVEIRENLIRDDRGAVTGMIRSLLDVTERNLAAVAARKVEQYAIALRHKNDQLGHALEARAAPPWPRAAFWPASPMNCAPP